MQPETRAEGRPSEPAEVLYTIDGDTVSVRRGRDDATVRLIGIDTPETKRRDTAVECFGHEAHQRLRELLPDGTPVLLEFDRQHTDRYQRELAYVRRTGDGLFVNLEMVRGGFADVLAIQPNLRYEEDLARAADHAKLARRGLWSACGSPHRAGS